MPGLADLFPGHFRKSPHEIDLIWQSGAIALDANVLLNLYRYSDTTADSFFGVLESFRGRLWLPWQAATEFHRNRLEVMDRQTRAYEATAKAARELSRSLENHREHPFVSHELLSKVGDVLAEVVRDLETTQSQRRRLLIDDPRLQAIGRLFQTNVCEPPVPEKLAAWKAEAQSRCEAKTPPGFRDKGKDGDRPFGDIYIWFELIELAQELQKPVIFVTDDAKVDWWLEKSGQTIGPLPDLVLEFAKKTNQSILFYRPDRFAEYGSSFLQNALEPGVVDEIRTQTASRRRRSKKRRFKDLTADHLHELATHLWMHRAEAESLLYWLWRLNLDQWTAIECPSDLPAEIYKETKELVGSCGCLVDILSDLQLVQAPGYNDAIAIIEPHVSKVQGALLGAFRQLPESAVRCVQQLAMEASME